MCHYSCFLSLLLTFYLAVFIDSICVLVRYLRNRCRCGGGENATKWFYQWPLNVVPTFSFRVPTKKGRLKERENVFLWIQTSMVRWWYLLIRCTNTCKNMYNQPPLLSFFFLLSILHPTVHPLIHLYVKFTYLIFYIRQTKRHRIIILKRWFLWFGLLSQSNQQQIIIILSLPLLLL